MEDFQDKYIDDAGELISSLENHLLLLEQNPNDSNIIEEVFRVMHTLKGSAGMFGFDKIGAVTHHLENVYDLIRNNELAVNRKIIDLTLESVDVIKNLLINKELINDYYVELYDNLLNKIKNFLNPTENQLNVEISEPEHQQISEIFYIAYMPEEDVFLRGVKPDALFGEMNEYGQLKIFPNFDNVPILEDFNPKKCYTHWEIIFETRNGKEEIEDTFLFMAEDEYIIHKIENNGIKNNKEYIDFINSNSYNNPVSTEILDEIINQLAQNLTENIEEEIIISTNTETKPSKKEKIIQKESKENIACKKINSIRVSSENLDELINLVSELVTLNSQLGLISERIVDADFQKSVGSLSKLSKRFRDNALELRLVPIQVLMVKFQRLVRDLSLQLNKEGEFVTQGIDTALDQAIINNLESPLMHIIRNSIDHGIEDAHERIAKGKPPKGIVRFIAFYSGASVFIQIQDDGRGIDKEKIRQKGIEKGIINSEMKLTDSEIYELIFLPGFSTAQNLTEVSGRGVGMDVVRQKISELRGEIEIDSELNLGSSFTLKLPLNLSIMDTLMVVVGNSKFLIPLSSIESCHRTLHEALSKTNRQLKYNNRLIPFIHLREEFGINGEIPEKEKIVVVKDQERNYALIVDEVVGEHQAVLKPLSIFHKQQEYLSGASILGDGSLALILDIHKLLKIRRI